ncbi:hypothetical protein O0L34_g18550 [Tuta absoluta]|nr:hypothetical protein O0L34_g18550 [Tuta absoluta]
MDIDEVNDLITDIDITEHDVIDKSLEPEANKETHKTMELNNDNIIGFKTDTTNSVNIPQNSEALLSNLNVFEGLDPSNVEAKIIFSDDDDESQSLVAEKNKDTPPSAVCKKEVNSDDEESNLVIVENTEQIEIKNELNVDKPKTSSFLCFEDMENTNKIDNSDTEKSKANKNIKVDEFSLKEATISKEINDLESDMNKTKKIQKPSYARFAFEDDNVEIEDRKISIIPVEKTGNEPQNNESVPTTIEDQKKTTTSDEDSETLSEEIKRGNTSMDIQSVQDANKDVNPSVYIDEKLLMPVQIPVQRIDVMWKKHAKENVIDVSKIDKNLYPGCRLRLPGLKPGFTPSGWHGRKPVKRLTRRYKSGDLRYNPDFEYSLKRLDVSFILKNAQLLADTCKPITVDIERMPVDIIEAYLDQQGIESRLRPRKKVKLTDIDEVRRKNKRILTAQVRPIVATQQNAEPQSESLAVDSHDTSDSDSDDSFVMDIEPRPSIPSAHAAATGDTLTQQELDEVLNRLTRKEISTNEKPRSLKHCCAARRSILYNRAKARIAARAGRNTNIVDLHAKLGVQHAIFQCDCCCRNALRDLQLSKIKLAEDMKALLSDLKCLWQVKWKEGSKTANCNSKESASAKSAKPKDSGLGECDENLSVENQKSKEKRGTKRKHKKNTKNNINQDENEDKEENKNIVNDTTKKAKNTTEEEKKLRQAAEYEEWMRQRNICAKYFTIDPSGSNKTKTGTKPPTTSVTFQSIEAIKAKNMLNQSQVPEEGITPTLEITPLLTYEERKVAMIENTDNVFTAEQIFDILDKRTSNENSSPREPQNIENNDISNANVIPTKTETKSNNVPDNTENNIMKTNNVIDTLDTETNKTNIVVFPENMEKNDVIVLDHFQKKTDSTKPNIVEKITEIREANEKFITTDTFDPETNKIVNVVAPENIKNNHVTDFENKIDNSKPNIVEKITEMIEADEKLTTQYQSNPSVPIPVKVPNTGLVIISMTSQQYDLADEDPMTIILPDKLTLSENTVSTKFYDTQNIAKMVEILSEDEAVKSTSNMMDNPLAANTQGSLKLDSTHVKNQDTLQICKISVGHEKEIILHPNVDSSVTQQDQNSTQVTSLVPRMQLNHVPLSNPTESVQLIPTPVKQYIVTHVSGEQDSPATEYWNDAITQPQIKALIETARANPGLKFMKVLHSPNESETVLATCSADKEEPKQIILRLVTQKNKKITSAQLSPSEPAFIDLTENEDDSQLNTLTESQPVQSVSEVSHLVRTFGHPYDSANITGPANQTVQPLNQPVQTVDHADQIVEILDMTVDQTDQIEETLDMTVDQTHQIEGTLEKQEQNTSLTNQTDHLIGKKVQPNAGQINQPLKKMVLTAGSTNHLLGIKVLPKTNKITQPLKENTGQTNQIIHLFGNKGNLTTIPLNKIVFNTCQTTQSVEHLGDKVQPMSDKVTQLTSSSTMAVPDQIVKQLSTLDHLKVNKITTPSNEEDETKGNQLAQTSNSPVQIAGNEIAQTSNSPTKITENQDQKLNSPTKITGKQIPQTSHRSLLILRQPNQIIQPFNTPVLTTVQANQIVQTLNIPGQTVVQANQGVPQLITLGKKVAQANKIVQPLNGPVQTVAQGNQGVPPLNIPGQTVAQANQIVQTLNIPSQTDVQANQWVPPLITLGKTVAQANQIVQTLNIPGQTVAQANQGVQPLNGPDGEPNQIVRPFHWPIPIVAQCNPIVPPLIKTTQTISQANEVVQSPIIQSQTVEQANQILHPSIRPVQTVVQVNQMVQPLIIPFQTVGQANQIVQPLNRPAQTVSQTNQIVTLQPLRFAQPIQTIRQPIDKPNSSQVSHAAQPTENTQKIILNLGLTSGGKSANVTVAAAAKNTPKTSQIILNDKLLAHDMHTINKMPNLYDEQPWMRNARFLNKPKGDKTNVTEISDDIIRTDTESRSLPTLTDVVENDKSSTNKPETSSDNPSCHNVPQPPNPDLSFLYNYTPVKVTQKDAAKSIQAKSGQGSRVLNGVKRRAGGAGAGCTPSTDLSRVRKKKFEGQNLSDSSPLYVDDIVTYILASKMPLSEVQILCVNTMKSLLKLRNRYVVVSETIEVYYSHLPSFWTLKPPLGLSQIYFSKYGKSPSKVKRLNILEEVNKERLRRNLNAEENDNSGLRVKPIASGTDNALTEADKQVQSQMQNIPLGKLLVNAEDFMYCDNKCFKKLSDDPLIYAQVFSVRSDLTMIENIALDHSPFYLLDTFEERLMPIQEREDASPLGKRVISLDCPGARDAMQDLVNMLNSPTDEFGLQRVVKQDVLYRLDDNTPDSNTTCTSGTNPCTSGINPCTSGISPCTSGINPCTTGNNPCTSDINPCTTGNNPCSSGINPCSSGINACTSGINPRTSGINPCTSDTNPCTSGNNPRTSGNNTCASEINTNECDDDVIDVTPVVNDVITLSDDEL